MGIFGEGNVEENKIREKKRASRKHLETDSYSEMVKKKGFFFNQI